MPLKGLKFPFLNVGQRFLAAQTAAARKPQQMGRTSLPPQQLKSSKMPNGLTVASLENYSPLTRIAVIVRCGSRYEDHTNLGITHALRNSAGLSTNNATIFGITRNIEWIGGNISATTNREYVVYSMDCIRDQLPTGMQYLSEVVNQPVFKRWELKDTVERMKVELAVHKSQPDEILIEALHYAAFKGGLGNSLFCPKFMVGKHTQEILQQFHKDHFNPDNMSVVGYGLEDDLMQRYAKWFYDLEPKPSNLSGATKYGGGEIRKEMDFPITYVAVVSEAAGWKNLKDAVSFCILQEILGGGPCVKYSEGTATKLGAAAAKATSSPFAISALNYTYLDTGIFGFVVAGDPNDMDKLVKSAVGQVRDVAKSGISDVEVKKAKEQLKVAVNLYYDNPSDALEDVGIQALFEGKVYSLEEMDAMFDSVTTQDVVSAAGKLKKGKPTMAAVGRLHNTPRLDELA